MNIDKNIPVTLYYIVRNLIIAIIKGKIKQIGKYIKLTTRNLNMYERYKKKIEHDAIM